MGLGFLDLTYHLALRVLVFYLGFGVRVFGFGLGFGFKVFGIWPRAWSLGFWDLAYGFGLRFFGFCVEFCV